MVSSASMLSCLDDELRTPPRNMTYAKKFRTFQERRRALMGEVVEERNEREVHRSPSPPRNHHRDSSLLTALEAIDESKITVDGDSHYRELYERERARNSELVEYIQIQEASKARVEQMFQQLLLTGKQDTNEHITKAENDNSPLGLKPVITAFVNSDSGKLVFSNANTAISPQQVSTSPMSSPPSSQSSGSCRRPCNPSPDAVKHCPSLGRQE